MGYFDKIQRSLNKTRNLTNLIMNYETARANMIEQQIRPWNVLEMQTLNALNVVRREDFVPESYRDLAFADIQIAISDNEVMLEPKVGARMIEALGLNQSSRVLEIGSGTGYLTALLAAICDHVTSIEINPTLSAEARRNLAMAGFQNTHIIESDCFDYINTSSEKFDAVLVTGSVPEIQPLFAKLISENGCIVGVQGSNPAMQAVILNADGNLKTLFETSVSRLQNIVEKASFTF
jgi:protein-L-isoaspartate(D-aspartate) O-methyltransferase